MTDTATLRVTTPTDREIEMTRAFDAPRRLVFDAFTKPELVKQWLLGPPGWSMPVCEIDLKVGGGYRYVWRNTDGREMGMRGVYREIVRPERIVQTEQFDEPWYSGEALVTTVLVEQRATTTVTTTVRYESREVRDSVLKSNMTRGVTASYDRLAELVASPEVRSIHMRKITPFLWFDDKAEEAMNFYVSIFKNSRIVSVTRYGDEVPGMKGRVLTGIFELDGQRFMALDGGPQFPFTEAISLFVNCETQQEVDQLWEKLTLGGKKGRCGWLKDKYGLSWQIIPTALGQLLQDKDAERSGRVMKAMLQMDKIDIGGLKRASEGQ